MSGTGLMETTVITRPATTVDRPSRSMSSRRWVKVLCGLVPLAAVLGGWQLLGSSTSFTFPPPSTWWESGNLMLESGELGPALTRTMVTFVLGTAASVVVGVLIGWAIGSISVLARAVNPILEFLRAVPAPTLVPVATVLFGVSVGMSVVVMVLAVVWPVLLNTASSRRTIPAVRLEAGQMLGLSRITRLRKVIFPSLLPDIMIGVRVSVSLGLVVSLLVDIIGSGEGLGRLLVVRQQSFDAPAVWAILVVIGVFGLIANALVAVLDRRVRRGWT